jgi:hypothetical protein
MSKMRYRKNKERVLDDGFKDTSPKIPLKNIIAKNPCQVKKFSTALFLIFCLILVPLNSIAVMQSENYKIKYESIGGGQGPEQSTNYKLFESIGEVGASQQQSTNYIIGGGQAFGIMSNLPPAPTLVNDGNPSYYNKLHFTINPGNNPSDTLFAIAITKDNWTTTQYIQNDNSVGDTLGPEDWQTYANWGGSSGELVTGLEPETAYKIKVKAKQGDFTMTGWGPESAEASTSFLQFSFSISANALDFGTLSPAAVSTVNYQVTTSTNGEWGYVTTIVEDGNLRKIDESYEISDVADGEVSAGHEEYGIRTSGSEGQMNNQDYAITSTIQTIASYSGPISNSQTTVNHKVSIDPSTPSGKYYHIVTLICTSTF